MIDGLLPISYKHGMDVKEIRRENLRLLAKEKGGPAKLVELLDMSLSYYGQIAGKTPIKGVGDKVARRVEEKLDLAHGWMDQAHTIASMDAELLVRAVKLVEDAMRAEGVDIPDPDKRARLYSLVYRRMQTATLDPADVAEFVRLAK